MNGARSAMEALEATLHREIAALEAGDFGALVATRDEKERLGAILERHLADDPGAIGRDRLVTLNRLIKRNAADLERAITATRDVRREIEGARDRKTISGSYGPSGQKHTRSGGNGSVLNKTF